MSSSDGPTCAMIFRIPNVTINASLLQPRIAVHHPRAYGMVNRCILITTKKSCLSPESLRNGLVVASYIGAFSSCLQQRSLRQRQQRRSLTRITAWVNYVLFYVSFSLALAYNSNFAISFFFVNMKLYLWLDIGPRPNYMS